MSEDNIENTIDDVEKAEREKFYNHISKFFIDISRDQIFQKNKSFLSGENDFVEQQLEHQNLYLADQKISQFDYKQSPRLTNSFGLFSHRKEIDKVADTSSPKLSPRKPMSME